MFKAIIIDDEKAGRADLLLNINIHSPEIEVTAVCASGAEGLVAIQHHRPDIVFLDIKMTGMNGFEMLERLHKPNFALIFVTAYRDYAVEAFDKNAVAYILKPFDAVVLKAAVHKAISKKIQHKELNRLLAELDELRRRQINENIVLKTQKGEVAVNAPSILYAESNGNYCWVNLASGERYLASMLLKDLLSVLPDYFCRIHRQQAVNMQQVRSYTASEGGQALLANGERLKVSRRYKQAFLRVFKNKN